jgi:dolichol-phosphate mannosyltransferase
MSRPKLSLVIPVFNEEATLPELERRLETFLRSLAEVDEAWEVVLVDDGSRDRSATLLSKLAEREPRYKVIGLSRNFGHQAAITAGLDRAEGEAVVVMDADLQDPLEVVRAMLDRAREGYDVVYGVRRKRVGETFLKKFMAAGFYRFMRVMTGVDIPADTGDFRLMRRPVVLTLRALREQHRFVRGMVAWIGFRQTAVHYDREARFAGETKYPVGRMLRLAVDGITSFSVLPLRITTWLGLLGSLVAVLMGLAMILLKLIMPGMSLPGWTGIMVAVAFGFSAQLLVTGILGEYVGRIFEEIKRRPLYIISREENLPPAPSDAPTRIVAATDIVHR